MRQSKTIRMDTKVLHSPFLYTHFHSNFLTFHQCGRAKLNHNQSFENTLMMRKDGYPK